MSDLVAFVTARLNEREAVARVALACSENGRYDAACWRVEDNEVTGDDGTEEGILIARARWDEPGVLGHIAANDPAHVLREVAAMRAIVALHSHRPEQAWDGSTLTGDCRECTDEHYPCATIRHLAAIWSEHEDYRTEWTP